MTASAAFGALISESLARTDQPVLTWAMLPVAGALEGACLGAAQALVVRGIVPDVTVWRWTAWTSAGMGLGWIVASLATFGGAEVASVALTAAASGLLLGIVLGAMQGRLLRRSRAAGAWTIANGLGWAGALAISALGAQHISAGEWTLELFGIVALTGTAAGAAAALVTGVTLLGLRPVAPDP
jgi:hypothetical protein